MAIFVAAGLLFATLTDSCMMRTLHTKLPFNRAVTCDVKQVVGQLSGVRMDT